MALSSNWRTIVRFALVGLAIGVVSGASFTSSYRLVLAVTFLVCPAFGMFFEATEIGSRDFYVLWALMALINAGLYTVIGATYVGIRKRRKSSATN